MSVQLRIINSEISLPTLGVIKTEYDWANVLPISTSEKNFSVEAPIHEKSNNLFSCSDFANSLSKCSRNVKTISGRETNYLRKSRDLPAGGFHGGKYWPLKDIWYPKDVRQRSRLASLVTSRKLPGRAVRSRNYFAISVRPRLIRAPTRPQFRTAPPRNREASVEQCD